jgi:hypothetical protein
MDTNDKRLYNALVVDAILDIDEESPLLPIDPNHPQRSYNTLTNSHTPQTAHSSPNRHPHQPYAHTHAQSDTLCSISENGEDNESHVHRTESVSTIVGIENTDELDSLKIHKVPTSESDADLESSPLLQTESGNRQTPLPWSQLLIILALQFAEPLSSQVINPFVVEVRFILLNSV